MAGITGMHEMLRAAGSKPAEKLIELMHNNAEPQEVLETLHASMDESLSMARHQVARNMIFYMLLFALMCGPVCVWFAMNYVFSEDEFDDYNRIFLFRWINTCMNRCMRPCRNLFASAQARRRAAAAKARRAEERQGLNASSVELDSGADCRRRSTNRSSC